MTQDALPSCEVIILTALPVECKAVLHFLQDPQEIVHQSGTIYYQGMFVGTHRTWHVAVAEIGMGGVTAALEAEKAISFFHARIALFVGIAGGLKDVQRGDVVVATKIYAYESGKAGQRFEPRPDLGHSSHALEQRARAEAHHDEWLARLEGDRPTRAPQVHLGALAAGEKVLASMQSDVARLLKETYGDTLAIEMEGHGFLHAIRVNQMVYGLVIRGISDLIDDKTEADASGAQRIAAQHATAFAFQVLAKFTLPSGFKPSSLLNLPFDRNPFFTGRQAELQELHRRLNQNQSAAIGQKSAVSGLGGIGKTQLAVEYAYRHHEAYHYVLWARADSVESLNASYSELATLLDLPEKDAQELEITIQAVKRWLQRQQGWLLILDNADRPSLLPDFLPSTIGGHLLITTRAADVSTQIASISHALVVEVFSDEQGTLFLLHRSGLLASNMTLDQAEPHIRQRAMSIVHELGGLPLALDQAGAYLSATGSSLDTYQQIYQQHRTQMLKEQRSVDYSKSVATTWSLSFEQVEQENPAAADLLRLCAFLAPEAIPEVILTKGAEELGPVLASVVADAYLLNEAIESLRSYSLIDRDPHTQELTIHRLVQAVLKEAMDELTQSDWAQRAVHAVNAAFPEVGFSSWSLCERCLPHARVCATYVKNGNVASPQAALLLYNAGYYLLERARYEEAEPLIRQALTIYEQSLEAKHAEKAACFDRLARCYELRGEYAQAELFYQRALEIHEQWELDHPDIGGILNNLALLYKTRGKFTEAEPLYRRALAVDEKVLGLEHPDVATDLNNLAVLYKIQGKYTEAEPLYRRALTIREQHLEGNHPDIAQSLNNLAALLMEQAKYEEAEALLLRVQAIHEQTLGVNHPLTATSLNNLAVLYAKQGKYEQAEPLLVRSLSISEHRLEFEHPDTARTLSNLAALYRMQKKYKQAEPLSLRALAIHEKVFSSEHPDIAVSLNNLALLYRDQGKYEEAEPLLVRALAIHEKVFGFEHADTAISLKSLAELYQAQSRYVQAEPLLKRALFICEQILGPEHPDTQTARKKYAALLETMRHQ